MALTILQFPHSPYCIPITRALEALDVPFNVENVSNGDRRRVIEATDGAYYQVPVLLHGDKTIHESGPDSIDVAKYVDSEFADGRLFPPEQEGMQAILVPFIENDVEVITFKLCDIHRYEAIDDVVEKALVRRHKERKFGHGCLDDWKKNEDTIRAAADELLGRFDQILQHRPFVLGDTPVYTDFALFGVIGNYTFGGFNALASDQSALRDWNERMAAFRF